MYQQVMLPLPFADWPFDVVIAETCKEESSVTQPLTHPRLPVLALLDRFGVEESLQFAPCNGLVLLAQKVMEAGDKVIVALAVVGAGVGKENVVAAVGHWNPRLIAIDYSITSGPVQPISSHYTD